MKQFMKMSFQTGLAAPTKSIKKLFRLQRLQNQPLTANVGGVPILDLVYK